jgi:hypothetical protein
VSFKVFAAVLACGTPHFVANNKNRSLDPSYGTPVARLVNTRMQQSYGFRFSNSALNPLVANSTEMEVDCRQGIFILG